MERFIALCNKMPFPMKEFIERTLGPGRAYRNPWIDRAMRWPPYTPDEDALDELQYGPARLAVPSGHGSLVCYEEPGGCIGHTAALLRADFR